MSRAFVKEPDSDTPVDEMDLPQSEHPNHVTPAGLAQLQARLADLEAQKQALEKQGESLETAAALTHLNRDIRFVEGRLERALPVDLAQQPRDRVAFGAIVTVEDAEGKQSDFAIVGEDEADVDDGKVSYVSPLARALMEAEIGDTITWKRPIGDVQLEVVAIRYPEAP
ncbi:MAG: GreA/GreB family elongation factor [Alphaproteobacteria bacterium]|nr:GreA/GreB family elongation factor [Alphaproteobacteria bacterium]MBU0796311.1 GreA/GreB family elongation factor [Alphaproteobacteria bacterium]MBU0889172.1 GreA/GreB family elongation factor [Alphaproteobacteria bacterium]MBU1812206.1 GreA/GreB family elongation factor [Alphaproteobacteria bacterium]MBU2089493.1 GreA/GreB family elongation factor [Alphaproteobacteria bacterium]